MNKTVHIFYNGFDYSCPLPQHDHWSNYRNSTSPRMFLQCAVSWQRNGWTVHRISSENITPDEGFIFKGRLLDSVHRYGYPYWNLWRVLAAQHERMLVCNMDCYNQDYTPEQYRNDLGVIGPDACLGQKAVSFHVNRWSNACMSVTPDFAARACIAFTDYDAGFAVGIDQKPIPRIEADWVSDEMIIRDNLQGHYLSIPRCDFGFIKPRWEQAPLINISRSVITRAMATIPVVR
jgi:hypothetical protein